eukprot:82202_1
MLTKQQVPQQDLDETTYLFYLLSGYIRELGVTQLYPDDIIRVCKRFSSDGWDEQLTNSGFKITNYEIVKRIDKYNGYHKNAFGSFIASYPGKYIWKVRINKINENYSMFTGYIGIKQANATNVKDSQMSFLNSWRGYGYKWGRQWKYQRNNKKYTANDVLSVELDFGTESLPATLTILDHKKTKLSSDKISPNQSYRLAFSTMQEHDTVEIVDFMCYNMKTNKKP